MQSPVSPQEIRDYMSNNDILTVNSSSFQNHQSSQSAPSIPRVLPEYGILPCEDLSDSFENWRVMQESGGRRVKRSVDIDVQSIRFCTDEERAAWQDCEWFAPLKDEKEVVNLRVFREYLTDYLRRHPRINADLTLMVRQLQPTPQGLPLEIYFFSADRRWSPYEHLQAEVFEYIYAIRPRVGLRAFQRPSGMDVNEVIRKI